MRHACTVERVIDGDTVEVDIDLGFGVRVRRFVRLASIETAELRGANRIAGAAARAGLRDLVDRSSWWVLRSCGTDRWGRVVGDLVHPTDGQRVTAAMVDLGFAWWIEAKARRAGHAATRGPMHHPGGVGGCRGVGGWPADRSPVDSD